MAAKEKEAPALPEGAVEVPKKKSRVKRIVIILAILLMTLSGAGIGGYWWLYLRTPSSSSGAPASDAAGASAAAKVVCQAFKPSMIEMLPFSSCGSAVSRYTLMW